MALTRKDWKIIGQVLLTTAGPSYAQNLRAKAEMAADPVERRRNLERAALVDKLAADPKQTVDSFEVVYDAVFGKPKDRKRKGSKKR